MSTLGLRSIKRVSLTFFFFFSNSPLNMDTRALSIQQKFRFEISEISLVQWNGTFRLHRLDQSHRTFGFCSRKQNAKERYWGKQFWQMERDISVRPTFNGGPQLPVGSNRKGPFYLIFNRNFRNFGLNGKRPSDCGMSPWCAY